MKTSSVIFILLLQGGMLFAQTSPSVSSTVLANVLKGSYSPVTYQASTVITDPSIISAGLLNEISADSLKATLFKMRNLQNRNMFSDTVSNTRGIGAARRWVLSKFKEYSAANNNRLQVGYLQFNYSPLNGSVGCPNSLSLISKHSDVIAVLPGSQTSNKSLI